MVCLLGLGTVHNHALAWGGAETAAPESCGHHGAAGGVHCLACTLAAPVLVVVAAGPPVPPCDPSPLAPVVADRVPDEPGIERLFCRGPPSF
jgi:hypothetical protein